MGQTGIVGIVEIVDLVVPDLKFGLGEFAVKGDSRRKGR
jgi:hypothetical protein